MKTNLALLKQRVAEAKGFSLIEMLVATAILSLTTVALLEGQAGSMRITSDLQNQAIASIVADSRMSIAQGSAGLPQPGRYSGSQEQFGTLYHWTENVRFLPNNDMLVIEVAVLGPEKTRLLVKRTGFRRVQ